MQVGTTFIYLLFVYVNYLFKLESSKVIESTLIKWEHYIRFKVGPLF